MNKNELYHYDIPGMKWGKRRYTNEDGSLNDKGIKRYAKKGYAQDSRNLNKTKIGKAYDRITGLDRSDANFKYASSQNRTNKKRAEDYIKEQQNKEKEKQSRKEFIKNRSKEIRRGQNTVQKILGDITNSRKYQAQTEYDLRNYND